MVLLVSVVGLSSERALAEPPRARLPELPSPGRLALSFDLWRTDGDRVQTGGMATLSIGLERIAAPRLKAELRPQVVAVAPSPPIAPQLVAPAPRADASVTLPSLRPTEIARVLRAAWRLADLSPEDDKLARLAARARSTAAMPELRLRAGRTVDRSLRLSSDEDGGSQQSTGGVGTYYEVRATFHLDRAVFADEEVALERIRKERAEERRKLTREVLDTAQALLRAVAKADDGGATPEEHLDAVARVASCTLTLDGLSDGAWSEVWAAAVARAAHRSAPSAPASELTSRRHGRPDDAVCAGRAP